MSFFRNALISRDIRENRFFAIFRDFQRQKNTLSVHLTETFIEMKKSSPDVSHIMPLAEIQNSKKKIFGTFSEFLTTHGVGKSQGTFLKFFFSAKRKATGVKLGTHVGHGCRCAPKIFGPYLNMYMTTLE
jgi:hypothetical protein